MNENIDLTKILDGCPVGTKFYSILQGEVSFINIDILADHPIIVSVYNKHADVIVHDSYAKDGKYNSFYDGECTLFPSKDQRDWSKFRRFWDKTEKFDPKFFQKDCKVLVRDKQQDVWQSDIFYGIADNLFYSVVCYRSCWKMGIPYDEKTMHLAGTKDDCPEYYKWWEE